MRYPELLLGMKKRPGLYFNNFSISTLRAFLDGYRHAAGDSDTFYVLDEFQLFIVKKFKINPVLSWNKIIRLYAHSDEQAFHQFFELFEEFLKENEKSK